MPARLPLLQIDAFTDRPFAGNPAAVCLLDAPADPAWMQHVAREMNLSETAFVHPEGDAYRLRWFTPTVEVELCGHATVATSHALWETGRLPRTAVARYRTLSGMLGAIWREGWIELDFPSLPAHAAAAPPGLTEALGVKPTWTGRSRFDALVEVATEAELRAAAPDFRALGGVAVRGTIVTARSDHPRFDFVSRFFAPAAGVNEDPVTGSAHSVLAPYWAAKLGKTALTGFQASARGGVVRVRLEGARVAIGGQAVTVLTGELIA
jgi:predicted PhzF superfamily epimerase YddE/YHI9